ncbi:MAG: pyridoxine 5'-phosphate synthase [Cocleimonas sp.]
MTKLSVNLNKIALLRNSRGRDYPNVVEFAKKLIALGVQGITVHPREDERHITRKDAYDLADFLSMQSEVEYNIEGYPSSSFLSLVHEIKPTQCTLVPDSPDQLTSDHGWDLVKKADFLSDVCADLNERGIRSALFLDPDVDQVNLVPETQAKRIELYTEAYANSYQTSEYIKIFESYQLASKAAESLGIGVNAGHDLDLQNLQSFLEIDNILEVSIGHALTIESIEQGMDTVVKQYLAICSNS